MIPVKMKIRPQFLPLIRNKIKLNEYRLASPKYSNIHVGDVIYLINNQNTHFPNYLYKYSFFIFLKVEGLTNF